MRGARLDQPMWRSLFDEGKRHRQSLGVWVREAIVAGIIGRRLLPGTPLPASRVLARLLGLSRNTVIQAYDGLVDAGFVEALPRQGHRVHPHLALEARMPTRKGRGDAAAAEAVRLPVPILQRARHVPIQHPGEWRSYPFPFVHGQMDPGLFPEREWRESVLAAHRVRAGARGRASWRADQGEADDPEFIEQVQGQLLPRRGIWVPREQILVTLGAQHALYLTAQLLLRRGSKVALEHHCYPDARNIFEAAGAGCVELASDAHGPLPQTGSHGASFCFLMPSHQNPTTVTMPAERRRLWLETASRSKLILIEDDYDSELIFKGKARPAIKAKDSEGRVIYVGSLSKTLAPGIRVGYLVGPSDFIAAARRARHAMMRHPPINNQRAAAFFIAQGHHQRYVMRLIEAFRERIGIAARSLRRHLPEARFRMPAGGSSLWVEMPAGVDTARLEREARSRGLLFDAGTHFLRAGAGCTSRYLRLGLSAIEPDAIEQGIRLLAVWSRPRLRA